MAGYKKNHSTTTSTSTATATAAGVFLHKSMSFRCLVLSATILFICVSNFPSLHETTSASTTTTTTNTPDLNREATTIEKSPMQSSPMQSSPIQFTTLSTSSSKPNRTLVIVTGSVRGGELAWNSLYKHVLDENSADLALILGQSNQRNSSLYSRAKYLFEFPEYKDWGDAIDQIQINTNNNSTWRTTVLPYFNSTGVKDILFGGVGTRKGSGAIFLMLRWYATQLLRHENFYQRYDRFIYTRADHYYGCAHHLSKLAMGTMWVPSGEDHGGLCDRHTVADRGNIFQILDLLEPILHHPEQYNQPNTNTEVHLLRRMKELHVKIGRFSRSMFTCAVAGDQSRWTSNKKNQQVEEGVFLKYEREYTATKKTCQKK